MNPSEELLKDLDSLMTGYWLTDLANFSAFFFEHTADINWVGFYLSDGEKLRLGPFQGRHACTEIAFDRGVCGSAFSSQQSLIVEDVHEFPGHIACDPQSRSELVIPLRIQNKKMGVLDIDSPSKSRFTLKDQEFFERALEIFVRKNPQMPLCLPA